MTTANEIREYVKESTIVPARRGGKSTVTFWATVIHKGLNLKDRFLLVCSCIDTD